MDEQLAEIERRRLGGKISHEEAILARQNLIQVYVLRFKQTLISQQTFKILI